MFIYSKHTINLIHIPLLHSKNMSSNRSVKSKDNSKTAKTAETTVEAKTEEKKVEKKVVKKVEETPEVEDQNEDQEPENEDENEEQEQESEEKKKSARKLPSKPKVVAKPASKSKGKANKSAEAAKQQAASKKEEEIRYALALETAATNNYTTVFDELSGRNVHDRFGQALTMHILETIDNIQRAEVTHEGDYNPFPAEAFTLFSDKVSGSSKKKASVKTKGSEPVKQKTVLKRGEKPSAAPKELEVQEVEEKVEDAEPEEVVNAEKAPTKRNITTVTKNGKTYLGFIVMRFVDEFYSSTGGKNVKNTEDFTKYVFEQITKDISSHLSRVIVSTVNRLRDLVGGLQDRGVEKFISENISKYFKDRPALVKFISEYLATYLKLLGHSLGHRIWVSKSGVNPQSIESAIRTLDFGNHEYMLANKLVSDDESDFGLSCGVLQEMRLFEALLNPGPTEEEKKARAAKRKPKPKADSKSEVEPKQRSRSKTKTEVEEPEEDEAEEEEEDEAEEEEEDDNVEVEHEQEENDE
jgi:hypothetical protein